MTRTEKVELVQRFLAGFGTKDFDDLFSILSDDAAVSSRRSPPPATPEERKKAIARLRRVHETVTQRMPNGLTFELVNIVVEGRNVCVEAKGDGTGTSGEPYNNTYHFAFEVANGKIQAFREYFDTAYLEMIMTDLPEIKERVMREIP